MKNTYRKNAVVNGMRFQAVAVEGKWETYSIIDTKTKQDLFYKVKGWSKEDVFDWCDGLNEKYKSKVVAS